MNIYNLRTPSFLLDLDILKTNILHTQSACNKYGKQLWPMIKTHKSVQIAAMQEKAGATGFLCGTLDECEALCAAGHKKIMYAYPVASRESILRVINLAQKCDFYIRLDDLNSARIINEIAISENTTINYTVIVDCGLHRFGMPPKQVVAFVEAMQNFSSLKFCGISSHSGEVYAASSAEEVPYYARKESESIAAATAALQQAGYHIEIVSTGSTPTFALTVADETINIYHPGNYVFYDCIQLSNGTANEDMCALTVLSTIISHPSGDLFICDAGAKCLGLDQGAHGNTSIVGYGRVKKHPEIIVASLSEEVGKLKIVDKTELKIGDKIEIIPNHSCSAANLSNYYVITQNNDIIGSMEVSARSNAQNPIIY